MCSFVHIFHKIFLKELLQEYYQDLHQAFYFGFFFQNSWKFLKNFFLEFLHGLLQKLYQRFLQKMLFQDFFSTDLQIFFLKFRNVKGTPSEIIVTIFPDIPSDITFIEQKFFSSSLMNFPRFFFMAAEKISENCKNECKYQNF